MEIDDGKGRGHKGITKKNKTFNNNNNQAAGTNNKLEVFKTKQQISE